MKMLSKLFLVLVSLNVIGLSDSFACACSQPQSAEEVRNYVHIFEGEVIAVEAPLNKHLRIQKVTFGMKKQIAGPAFERLTIEFTHGDSSCDPAELQFAVGETWLISDHLLNSFIPNVATKGREQTLSIGRYASNFCSLILRLSSAPNFALSSEVPTTRLP